MAKILFVDGSTCLLVKQREDVDESCTLIMHLEQVVAAVLAETLAETLLGVYLNPGWSNSESVLMNFSLSQLLECCIQLMHC